jgi:hypothetical protein
MDKGIPGFTEVAPQHHFCLIPCAPGRVNPAARTNAGLLAPEVSGYVTQGFPLHVAQAVHPIDEIQQLPVSILKGRVMLYDDQGPSRSSVLDDSISILRVTPQEQRKIMIHAGRGSRVGDIQ